MASLEPTAKISKDGRVFLCARVREALGASVGDSVAFSVVGGAVTMRRVSGSAAPATQAAKMGAVTLLGASALKPQGIMAAPAKDPDPARWTGKPDQWTPEQTHDAAGRPMSRERRSKELDRVYQAGDCGARARAIALRDEARRSPAYPGEDISVYVPPSSSCPFGGADVDCRTDHRAGAPMEAA